MHELSIAMRLVESLEEELANEGDLTVITVNIRIGALTGLVPEALEFSWEIASDDGRLKGSKLAIETVDAAGYCPQCQEERTISNLQSFRCPVCLSPIKQITGGHELEILTLEVLDHEADADLAEATEIDNP